MFGFLYRSFGMFVPMALCLGADFSNAEEMHLPSVEMNWNDGDQLQGNLMDWQNSVLSMESNMFEQPVGLHARTLGAVRFASGSHKVVNSETALHELTLIDGSRLSGQLMKWSDQAIRFKELRLGEMEIDATQVAKIEGASQVLYGWNGELQNWQTGDESQWQVDGTGQLVSSKADSQIWLPLNLSNSFTVEISVAANQSLDFLIGTSLEADNGLRLCRMGDTWILGTANDFEIADKLPSKVKQWNLQLLWQADSRTWSLIEKNNTILSIADPKAESTRAGILLRNQGKSLAVQSLRVSTVNSQSPVELPNISRNVEPPELGATDRIQWADGSTIWCSIERIHDGKVSLKLPACQQFLQCSTDSIRNILPRQNTPASAAEELHELRLGTARMRGRFELDQQRLAVVWHSPKLVQAVDVNLDLPIRIQQVSARATLSDGFTDMAFFQNGDSVPCSLLRSNTNQVWLKTPLSREVVTVSRTQLNAVELLSTQKNQPTFTNESRKMLLSIPRNLEVDNYSHAVIGRNGDLLRGNLVSMNEKNLEIDSHQVPMLLDRSHVSSLVFLHSSQESSVKGSAEPSVVVAADSNSGKKDETTLVTAKTRYVRIGLVKGFRISGNWTGGSSDSIRIQHGSLGECEIPLSQVASLTFHQEAASENASETLWATMPTQPPKWLEEDNAINREAKELVGQPAPKIALANLSGQTIQLADYHGKVVILDFWATWCGACVASLPKYLNVVRDFPDTQVVFFGVNSSETPETIRQFLDEKNWNGFSTLLDFDESASQAMQVHGIPHTVVIGPDGKIVHVQSGYTSTAAEELKQMIEKLLH